MEDTKDPFKEAISCYLQEMAKSDKMFAITFNKPNKNCDDCITYILNQVKKSGRQGFADDEIYNMAMHYYDEDSIEIGKPLNAKVVINQALAVPPQKVREIVKTSTKNANVNQTSLFNF